MSKSLKVGWIGFGVMGKAMCHHVIKKGYQVNIWNRTKSKTDEAVSMGAKYLDPEEVAARSDVLFVMLGYPQDVKNMILDERALIKYLNPGSILVDHTTSSPSLAKELYTRCKEKGISSIDAPVSGGDVGAKNGTLVTMVGGDPEPFEKAKEVMETYSQTVKLMGGAGQGQNTKACNQICIANNMVGVVEALVFGHKAGLNLEELIKTIEGGAAGSFSLRVLGPRMLKRDFDPGFFVEHFVKDMEIILHEARRNNLCLPGISLSSQLYNALMAHGGAKMGTQALLLALEQLNNVKLDGSDKKL